MGQETPVTERDFFRQPLREQINPKHPLVRLADLIKLGAAMATKSKRAKRSEVPSVSSTELEELDSREFAGTPAIIHIPAEKQLGFFERKIINVLLVNGFVQQGSPPQFVEGATRLS